MFEFIGIITRSMQEIEHLSAWTGLSVGVLAAIAFVAWLDPDLRKWAFRAGILIIIGYATLIYGYHHGAADVRQQWTAANIQAAKDAKQRDADAQRQAEAVYKPIIEAREQMIAELDQEVDEYGAQLAKANDPCVLGDALWLRRGTAVPHSTPAVRKPNSAPGVRANPQAGGIPVSDGKDKR